MNSKHACADALALLSLSLDEELSPLERLKLERHFGVCPDCGRKSADIEAITCALRALPLETPSLSALPHLPRRRRIVRTGVPAVAAVLVAAFSLATLQGSVNGGPGAMTSTGTVSHAALSPVTHSLPQPQEQYASAAVVWLP